MQHAINRTALVTGGAGFVGVHICRRLLSEGYQVLCLDDFSSGTWENVRELRESSKFMIIDADVCDSFSHRIHELYHFACPASPVQYKKNPVQTIRTCVQGTLSMLEVARAAGAKLLLASTSEVYGDPDIHPQAESYWGNTNPIGERSCYNEGKRCAESLVTSYGKQFGVETAIIRIFNTYGPYLRRDDGRVVSTFITQALSNAPITVFGAGSQTRSFCYVDDLVDGIFKAMDTAVPEPINLGNPEEIRMTALAERIIDLTNSKSKIVYQEGTSDDPRRRRPDITTARELLDWVPQTSLNDGLLRTIQYFDSIGMRSVAAN